MIRTCLILAALIITLASCKVEPQPIDYGNESCHFCSMTIVDKQHAAQIVTGKGKAFNYDAIECMVNDLGNQSEEKGAIYSVNDYQKPGELIDATRAIFLLGSEIPSPMGAYLSASRTFDSAKELEAQYGGHVLTWEELKTTAAQSEDGRL